MTYDDFGHWEFLRYPDGTGLLPYDNTSENFNKADLISRMLDSNGDSTYVYHGMTLKHDVYINSTIKYNSARNFVIQTEGSIFFDVNSKIINGGSGSIILKTGLENHCNDDECPSIVFGDDAPHLFLSDKHDNLVKFYYHAVKGDKDHKYQNRADFSYAVSPHNKLQSYMFVGNVKDLQMVNLFLSGNYALSQNINASVTRNWDNGRGFLPLGKKMHPFSGDFEGNEYTISNLFINRPERDHVGLFGFVSGGPFQFNKIARITIEHFNITGRNYVGLLAGESVFTNTTSINCFEQSVINGQNVVGGMIGKYLKKEGYKK
jgi:hypothetical protein